MSRFWRWFTGEAAATARYQAVNDVMDRRADIEMQRCDICSGRESYVCPKCGGGITHSHENDFICEAHGFISPLRVSDGAVISGDGRIHPPHVCAP